MSLATLDDVAETESSGLTSSAGLALPGAFRLGSLMGNTIEADEAAAADTPGPSCSGAEVVLDGAFQPGGGAGILKPAAASAAADPRPG